MSDDPGPDAAGRRVPTRLGALHVRVVGDGPVVLLWPSMFVDSHTYDLLVPLLPATRRYVLVDGPGLGLSDPLTVTSDIDGAAGAALDLLAALDIDGPIDWIGNAFGGHVGYKLGAMPSVLRSLVAISAPPQALPDGLRRQIALLKPLLRVSGPVAPIRTAVVKGMLTDRSAADARLRAIVLDGVRRADRHSLIAAIDSFILNRLDVTAELADIAVPCLYIASDDRGDWSPADAARAAALTPDATTVTVAGARTLAPLEQPAEVARLIAEFWDRLD